MSRYDFTYSNKSEYAVDVWRIGQETIDALIDAGIRVERHPAGFYRVSFNPVNCERDHDVFFTSRKTKRVFHLGKRDESARIFEPASIDGFWLKLMPAIPEEEKEIRHSRDMANSTPNA